MGLFSSIKNFTKGIGDVFEPISGLVSGAASAYGAYQQQKSSQKMAKNQMQFQENMSNTAHQRQVSDLRAAGLNPILSANKGASSPGGAMGQAQNIGQAGVNSALTAQIQRATIANIHAQTGLTNAQTDAITPISTFGEEVGKGYQWGKSQIKDGVNSAKNLYKNISEGRYSYAHPPALPKTFKLKPHGRTDSTALPSPTLPKHSKSFSTGRKRKLFDHNPGNADGKHFWVAKTNKWYTAAELKKHNAKTQSKW